ncbi:MAG: transglycosylase domain-containing protein [Bacilli bacterium]|nr:transglycosylase domain-containing protein [Bacilli bacterium]
MANNRKKKTANKKPQPSKKKTVNNKKGNNINNKKRINNDEIRKEDKSLDIAIYNSKKHTNNLKEYDLKKIKNINKRKNRFNKFKSAIGVIFEVIFLLLSYLLYFILYPIKILFIGICKLIKKIPKNIKKIKIKQYNRDRKKKNTENLPKKQNIRIKKEKNKIKDNDELDLLHYRDFRGLKKIYVFFENRLRVMKFDMRRFKKKFKYGTLKDKILIILMILLILLCCLLVAGCVYIVISAPDPSSNKLFHSNASVLYYKNDKGEWEEFARLGSEKREKITYDKIPEVLIDAIVATEDSRYFQHDGIDIARFTKATIGQLLGQRNAGGGSTLTMQVSKNNFTSSTATGIKGVIRKFTDIYLSVFVLEKKYTKEEIMEFYVNYPYLGSYSYGVEQACNSYFGKSATDLNLVEAATIAGLFQAPYSYDPYQHPVASEKRRNTVLNLMYRHGYITEEERDTAQAIPLESTLVGKKPSSKNKYQDYIDTLLEYIKKDTGYDPTTTAMKVYTTLKPQKQEVVESVINGDAYKWRNDQAQAGIVVTDVKTGAIVAVGASRDPAERVLNFATSINRHPGSTAKPILDYGPAFEYLNWSTGQTVIDDEIEYTGGYGSVRNFDNKFKGILTAKTALAQSRNVPALLTFRQTTNEQKRTFSNNLGWHAEDKNGVIYESASIGGFEGVNPVKASAAYAAFARGGTYISPYIYEKIEFLDDDRVVEPKIEKVNVMSEETAYLVNNILQYAVNSGTISAAKSSICETAAKTGTSTVPASAKEAAGIKGEIVGNSWLNVYSTDYSISTWYGYKNEVDPTAYLTSNEGSSERKKITKILVAGIMEAGAKFDVPSGIVTAEVELETDPLELASPYTPENLRSTEYFKKGTVPESVSTRFSQLSNPSNLKYSSDGTNVALTWTAAATPDAVNTEYLRNYFTNSPIYSTWAEKYLNRRLQYNDATFGSFGYEIFMINDSGTVDLGFTTNTTFTVKTNVTQNTKFMVKSSYQKFKNNQSPGIYISANGTQTPSNNNSMSIQYNGETCSSKAASYFQGDTRSKIKVTVNGQDVTSKATISNPVCRDEAGNEINCRSIVSGKKYTATYAIRYNGENRNKQITISPSC